MTPESMETVRTHLREVLDSEEFAGSERRRDLLRFIVDETLAGRGDALKAYSIGTKALGRASGFDPQADPIVRVEVGRLRATLDRYYRAHTASPVVIAIPKGRYRAEFEARPVTAAPHRSETVVLVDVRPFVAQTPSAAGVASAITESTRGILTSAGIGCRTVPAGCAARFVLEGTVRASGDRLRVVTTLVAGGVAEPIWSRHIDRETAGAHEFDLADDVAARIAWPIADTFGVLRPATTDRHAGALDRYRRSFEALSVETSRDARSLLDHALATDPVDARSRAAMSDALFTAWWLDLDPPTGALERAEDLATAAIALDPTAPDGHLAAAYVHYGRGRQRLFRLEIDAAVERAGNSPNLLVSSGLLRVLAGDVDAGVALIRRGVDLNPEVPAWWHLGTCVAAVAEGDLEAALVEAVQIGDSGAHVGSFMRLALKSMLGHDDLAADAKALLEFDEHYGDRMDDRLTRIIRSEELLEPLLAAVRDAGVLPVTIAH